MLLSIVRTTPQLDRFGQLNLRHLGLGLTDFVILESVLHAGPLTPSRLGDRVGLTRGSITSAVDRLAARGLVTREPNAADARSSLVKLTPIGVTVIESAWKSHAEAVEQLIERGPHRGGVDRPVQSHGSRAAPMETGVQADQGLMRTRPDPPTTITDAESSGLKRS